MMLRQIARSPHRTALMVLAAYRETEPSEDLAETLADLGREGLFERQHLSGLGADDVREMIASIRGDAGEPKIDAQAIQAETGGNPFLVEALVNHIASAGEGRAIGRRAGAIYATGVPELVREAVGHRIGELDEAAANVLEVASVIGSEFGSDLVTEVSEMPGEDVIASLETAVAAGLLADVPGTLDRYAFSHALFRQAVYAGVPRVRRADAPPTLGRDPRAAPRERPQARRRAGAPLRRRRPGSRGEGTRVRGSRRSRSARFALIREGDRALQRGPDGTRCLRRGRPEAAARAAPRPGRGRVARRGGGAVARELRLGLPDRPLDRGRRGARPGGPRLLRLRLGAGRQTGRRRGAAEECARRLARRDGAAGSPRSAPRPDRTGRRRIRPRRQPLRRGTRAGGARR